MGKGGNWRKQGKGGGGGGKGWHDYDEPRPSDIFHQGEEEDLQPPSFMGAASRKRKWELAAEMGLVPAIGWSHAPPPASGYGGNGKGKKGGGKGKDSGKSGRFAGGSGGKESQKGGMAQAREKIAPSASAGGKPSGGASGKGAKKAAAREPEPAPVNEGSPADTFRWIRLQGDSALVVNGLPDSGTAIFQAPCVQHLLSCSVDILTDLGIDNGSLTFTHDQDGSSWPDVAEVLKEEEGKEDVQFCVVECPDVGLWAAGVSSVWKKREQAARLALCVGIAAMSAEFENLQTSQPDFVAYCQAVGIETGIPEVVAKEQPPAKRGAAAAALAPQHGGKGAGANSAAVPKKRAKFGAGPNNAAAGGAGAAPADPAAELRDKPFWIKLNADEDLPEVLEGMPPEALVLSTQTCARKGLYDKATDLLENLLSEGVADITEHDDPNWEQFPIVGAVIKEKMGTEECLSIMLCPQLNCWAVGVGMKAQMRKQAAKAALAITAALQHVEFGQEVDYTDYPVMGEVADEATNAKLQA
eukprot:CAMPEP_0206452302 /NCGR_PEP_ID=MMETSP0324_2-20121206/19868_1 /ASSEMBLY_ACC=CAM_ASM_000836 /TAXON_ID=2866 /ORGANISM="Crypthecodinium cohnii, Strain Seligo" /LENGTH=526 /DNA_ID=CAMNT_0053922373 /DNA_START=97 /DNA_END=1677 /DNA_ORIENTATION=-